MTLKLQSLGFFKSIKAQYYLKDNKILFSCFYCGQKTEMDEITSQWSCLCGNSGNLGNLIRYNTENPSQFPKRQSDFVNPQKEKNEINIRLNKLRKTTLDKEQKTILEQIQNRFSALCDELKI